MSVVKVLSAVVILLLSSLACEQAVVTVTPTTLAEAVTTPDNTPTLPPTPSPVPTAADTAVIVVPQVNVRQEPDGAVIGSLAAGDSVKVIECVSGWCRVEYLEQVGYIWAGCLSIESDLLCEAK